MRQNPETVTSIVLACCTLHNIMRLRYPGIHQVIADEEDDNHRVIPGLWRQGACLQDIEEVAGGNRDSLFGVLRHFQHCTGHITTGSWKGRGNQYI